MRMKGRAGDVLGQLGCCWDHELRSDDQGGAGASSPELLTLREDTEITLTWCDTH